MTELDTIALYGPGNLKPEDLVAGFVARENTLNYFLAELRHQTAPNASPRHHLIVGQRGMGKTTLLHRIAIAIGEDKELAEHFLPLTFREEQYNVINLHVFWCNCIEALLDRLEQQSRCDEVKKLEDELLNLEDTYAQNRKQELDGNAASRVFRLACQRLQRRPVLLLDNLDLILDALKKDGWGLREALQQSDGPLVIGAAPAYPKGLSDKKTAFFDFFRITILQRLEAPEVRACLHRLARKRGEAGQRVSELLHSSPGRITALTEMTGGNPRTLAVLYLLLESQAGEDAFADLEKLLDRMTPLYKARAEEPPPQARAVLDAVALAWDPITAAEVSRESGLEVTVVNAQLSRLEKDGFLEKVEVSGSGRHGYQMIERFFNIWYLMRHGSRRLKLRVRWLTSFLRGFYSANDRENLARDYLRVGNHYGRADLMLALSESVEDPIYRKALNHAAGRDLLQNSDIRERIRGLVDLRDIDPEQADMSELERKVLAIDRDWPQGLTAQEGWDLLGGSLEMSGAEKRRIVETLSSMDSDKLVKLAATLRKEIVELCETLTITAAQLTPYRAAVRDGSIRHCYDLEGASAAALHENLSDIAAIGCLVALNKDGDLDEVRKTQSRFSDQTGELWTRIAADPLLERPETAERVFKSGISLDYKYKEFEDAELAYQKAIALNPENPRQWNNLGNLLQHQLGRYEEAEEAYHKAIELDSKFAWPWLNLGNLLQFRLKRYEEAEAAYRKAIELNPENANLWNDLGRLLYRELDKYEEAEEAYRKAIELDSKFAWPWNNLGNLLQYRLERYEEAEAAYRKSMELDPNYAYSWGNLGDLLQYRLERYEEAEAAYRKAIELNPEYASAWRNLGRLLEYNLNRYEESEAAFRRAIKLEPDDSHIWNTFGVLLHYRLCRYEEAEQAYFRALELSIDNDFPYSHGNLAFLYWLDLNRPEAAQHHAALANAGLDECGKQLLEVARLLAEDSVGLAWSALDGVLTAGCLEKWDSYGPCLSYILRHVYSHHYGAKFREWMEAADYPARYAPLYWAFLALLEGEDILHNVNPEVRNTAKQIYQGLAVGVRPETPAPKRKRRRPPN
jgi:tetratricopeptide (TPR) repeat protein